MSGVTTTISAKARYLSILGAKTIQEVEARIVTKIETALGTQNNKTLPVRLSTVAPAFSIEARPKFVDIHHDGEIVFDDLTQCFTIRLRTPETATSLQQLGANPRYRFTYAHEMAHRFLFVRHEQTWKRALDVATEGLETASRLREKVTLSRIEEGLCNSVARRILIPDSFISERCPLDAWFCEGPKFFSLLTEAARACCVSRDVLLVRLERSRQASEGAHFALIMGRSAGAVTNRGRRVLRAMSGSLPANRRRQLGFYPGMSLEELGPEMLQFASEAVATKDTTIRDCHLNISPGSATSIPVFGWWRALGHNERFMMWGRFG